MAESRGLHFSCLLVVVVVVSGRSVLCPARVFPDSLRHSSGMRGVTWPACLPALPTPTPGTQSLACVLVALPEAAVPPVKERHAARKLPADSAAWKASIQSEKGQRSALSGLRIRGTCLAQREARTCQSQVSKGIMSPSMPVDLEPRSAVLSFIRVRGYIHSHTHLRGSFVSSRPACATYSYSFALPSSSSYPPVCCPCRSWLPRFVSFASGLSSPHFRSPGGPEMRGSPTSVPKRL
jgi:hypothetical protein